MMKVLQLIDSLDAGGAERMAVNIANANARAGIDSYVCSTVRSGPLEAFIDDEVAFKNLGKSRRLDLRAFVRFFKYVKMQEIAIIHAHSTSIQLAVLTKLRFPKVKIIWHNHYGMNATMKGISRVKFKLMARFIDAGIAVSAPLKNFAEQTLHIKKSYFINNFSEISRNTNHHTELKGEEGKRIICLANLRPVKNHLRLIMAFKKSLVNGPSWTLHLVGKDFGDEYSKAIVEVVKSENLEASVFYYGSQNDISHILSQATCGVLASTSEGLPLSLLEYGSASLPVITTDVGQCSTVIGMNGIVISDVIEELPDAFNKIYSMSIQELKSMGLNYHKSIKKQYSEDAFMARLLPIYNALIS